MDAESKPNKPVHPEALPDLPGYYPDPPLYQSYPSTSGAGPYLVQLPANYPPRNFRYPPGCHVIQIQGSTVVTGRAPISVKPRPHATLLVMLCVFLCVLFFIVPIILGIIFTLM